ncbi:putative glycosyltransferase [Pseudohyphozyma bogoriensis]|nr:putative glycosyltransferase [Pseudohyphozyma bogoriensis]
MAPTTRRDYLGQLYTSSPSLEDVAEQDSLLSPDPAGTATRYPNTQIQIKVIDYDDEIAETEKLLARHGVHPKPKPLRKKGVGRGLGGAFVGLCALIVVAAVLGCIGHVVTERALQVPRPKDEYVGVEQWRGEWSDEELELRKYGGWPDHQPHESLLKIVDGLSKESRAAYDWLRTTRADSNRGTAIGLASSDPPERIQPAPPAWHPTGPGKYTKGSPSKFGDLMEEWRTGRQHSECEKGSWEDEYTQLHASMLNGSRTPRMLEYRCPLGRTCGGLSDRMFGAISTFTSALLTGRAFSAAWEYFLPIDLVFDSPYIDWSLPYHPNTTRHQNPLVYDRPEMADGPKFYDADVMVPGSRMDAFMKERLDTDWDNAPWAWLLTNIGSLIRTLKYVSPGREKLMDLGLKPRTAYACVFNYLFRPKPSVLKFVAQYTSLFALPDIFAVTIQIRTGDQSMQNVEGGDVDQVEKYGYFFQCAERVSQVYARQDQKIVWFLLSDSEHLKQAALRVFPDKVVVSGIGASHLGDQNKYAKNTTETLDRFQDSIADSWIQEGADFQLITRDSGFGRLHAFRRGKSASTITISVRGGYNPPDCGLESAVANFEYMIEDTSLG